MVRTATIRDTNALAALCAYVQRLHVARRPDVFGAADTGSLAEWFRARLTEDVSRCWLAERGDLPVGYAFAVLHHRDANPFTHALRWLEIVQLGVHPDHQRTGIGRSLVHAAVAEAETLGISDIRIRTWAFNEAAQRSFQRLGFRPRTIDYGMTLSHPPTG